MRAIVASISSGTSKRTRINEADAWGASATEGTGTPPRLERVLLSRLAAPVVALSIALAISAWLAPALPLLGVLAVALALVAGAAATLVYGRHLVRKLVIGPLESLTATANAIAPDNPIHRAPQPGTREFAVLASRFNSMTEHVADVQRQFGRAEQLAAIGRMAAGIAHEIGNPLAAMKTYLAVLEQGEPDPEIVQAITREMDRIDRIVRGLLDSGRTRRDSLTEVDLGAVAQAAIDLLTQQGALKKINVVVECDPMLPRIVAQVHVLEQLMVNLILNAVDAAPGGSITVGTLSAHYRPFGYALRRRGDARDRPVHTRPRVRRPWRPELSPGTPGVLIIVADSGDGVPEEHMEHIFEPFYTTKEAGKGTGLGLAIVQRTAYDLGGIAWVDPAREGGAAFKVFLPSAQEIPPE
jgi:signal transduction histidine kinase